MDDTLAEVDLDEWNNAFVGAMTHQLTTLYPEKDVKGKAFLVKATGRALTAVKNRTLILDTLALIFNATQHSGKPCSVFFSRILTHKIR